MKPILLIAFLLGTATPAMGETILFNQQRPGVLPAGWVYGVTGHGNPKWSIERDTTGPDLSNVLRQSGVGDFPWCVKQDVSLADGFVEVRFKPVDGREDQAGGVVWRWKDGNNYYVARANALENNISLYYTTGGRRHTIQYRAAPVAARVWHTLRVDFTGNRIQVALDGKRYIDVADGHIAGTGAVGVWTKADSVTLFDALSFDGSPTR
ncbi:hypothetical protein [Cupriavidus neocaledonicus]|uniref:3-keto-disaccharide hydrolase domain-containing protein n=1 Tax=Cupriavidus neocaledonicus TaxID=1040979 RepID=A0A375H680_9BURK|nr:hypothetical protein [Cupriavidus neocaledonicus]SOZ38413.1 conserved exported hypothetical protein [Cupriavidus neocaledonicus]SPD46745.1 conserved exported protein of unknown function [Cupriavidus neocaledonicus]